MNLKSVISFEIVKNNKDFAFQVPAGAMFEECYSVLDQLMVELNKMEAEQKAKAEAQANPPQAEPVQAEVV